jgi:hypothetical protein
VRLIRSWPATVPEGRSYVQDDLPRLAMDGHDYRCLADVADDILLLEWDIAVGKEDLRAFANMAQSEPDRVLVAPYRLYDTRPPGQWAHRRYEGTPETGHLRHVTPDDRTCHLWGLGMTYLPRVFVEAYMSANPAGHVSDGTLSGWHHRNVSEDVPIAWHVRPVHLHYPRLELQ